MYFRKFPLEFVAYKLSLNCNWQGYVTSFSGSLVRYNSTKSNRHLFRELYNLSKRRNLRSLVFRGLRIMGNKFSPSPSGRKFSPKKKRVHRNHRQESIETIVCKENELQENEMKVVSVGKEEGKVLLIKQGGKIFATGTKCTHYGAPLVKGILGNGRIRCPWHGACFNISSGDIEDFPGFDSLPCYEVKVSDGQVTVVANNALLAANKRESPFLRTVKPKSSTFLVVGGGPAGIACVENLRKQGFEGRLIFILGENHLPYDRVKLSKALDVNVQRIIVRSKEFYQERNIEIMLGCKLTELNAADKMATLSNGESLKYDKIFLATGSTPRGLNVTGSELRNIFVLRTVDDARNINKALSSNSKVVILGTSFIGMEAAAYCAERVSSVVVIGKEAPFKAVFGSVIANRIMQLFEEKNVRFELGKTIQSFVGENGKLTAVELTGNGSKLAADVCILGIGATPNTGYLQSSGINLKKGLVEVNEYMQTHSSDVFAGGDIVLAPVLNQKANIGHWGLASYHGHIAAFNMLHKKKPLKAVPFFWTSFFGKGIRYAGYAKSCDDVVIDGSVDDLSFIAFNCYQGYVVSVTTLNRDPLAAKFAEMLYEGKELKKNSISNWIKG